jgi:hypothetical protein
MKVRHAIGLGALALASLTAGAQSDRSVTLNKQVWQNSTIEGKQNLVIGLIRDYELGQMSENPHAINVFNIGAHLTVRQMVDGVDNCFDDGRYDRAGVFTCMFWAQRRASGVSAQELDSYMQKTMQLGYPL